MQHTKPRSSHRKNSAPDIARFIPSLTALAILAGGHRAGAQEYFVTNINDSGPGSLRQAILDANDYSGPTSTPTSVIFENGLSGTIQLQSMLPVVTQSRGMHIDATQAVVTVHGGSTGAATGDRVFFFGVNALDNTGLPDTHSASFSISGLFIRGGNARGGAGGSGAFAAGGGGAGMGGAIFLNAGNLTLSDVLLFENRATGGAGGAWEGPDGGAGGGGGMGGPGGNGSFYNAGGGGGFGLTAAGGSGTTGTNGNPGSPGAFFRALPGGNGSGGGTGSGGAGGLFGGGGGGSSDNQSSGGGGVGGGSSGPNLPGGNGGFGGGGGAGGGQGAAAGAGGYGGGGGASSINNPGGTGGFGGGGGAGLFGGAAGFGGGFGGFRAFAGAGGGGGAGLGGAVFVRQGATLNLINGAIGGGSADGGVGGFGAGNGFGIGSGIFPAGDVNWYVSAADLIPMSDTIGGGSDPLISGSFTKSGPGALELSGENTHAGTATVAEGTLINNGSLASVLTVATGATLAGSGSFSGLVTTSTGAHLRPGNSPGAMTFSGGLDLSAGAILDFELGSPSGVAGVDSDVIDVTGGFLTGTAGTGIIVNLSDAGGLAEGVYELIRYAGASAVSLDVSDFTLGTTPAGHYYRLSLDADALRLSIVPEPGSLAIAGLAAAGLLLRRRR